ncbi:MAG: hypothetical protein ACTJLM_01175 [Ehrlichia sp.]
MDTGVIVIIALAALIAMLLLMMLCFFCCVSRSQRDEIDTLSRVHVGDITRMSERILGVEQRARELGCMLDQNSHLAESVRVDVALLKDSVLQLKNLVIATGDVHGTENSGNKVSTDDGERGEQQSCVKSCVVSLVGGQAGGLQGAITMG